MVVIEIGSFYDELSFRHCLQHYSGTTKTTEIQLWLFGHREVYCDKVK